LEETKRRKSEDQHSYNTNNVLRLVGNGPLTDEQKQALTEAERNSVGAR
jgi:hypothetical protein